MQSQSSSRVLRCFSKVVQFPPDTREPWPRRRRTNSTRRPGRSASNDPGLAALLDAHADAICFVAKAWDYHVKVALETTNEENLASIRDSVRAAKARAKEVLLDCEHFFDGYKHDRDYGVRVLEAAGAAGADFLCYVTPSEHLRLPDLEDVREGVIASRIAAHAADIAKGVKGAMDWDREMSRRRKALDWKGQIELSINPERARRLRESSMPKESDVCTMCGEFCSMKGVSQYLKKEAGSKK